MKKSFYGLAYRIVSWLSDRTGGWKALVNWKIALAVLIIGVPTATLTGCDSNKDDEAVVACYITMEDTGDEDENPDGPDN